MKGSRVFPRAASILRSVMVAGAGTAIWMALSATTASADAGASDNHSLLGGVTSTVSSAVSPSTAAVKGAAAEATTSVGATTAAATNAVGSVTKAAVPQATAPTISIPVPNVPLPAPVKPVVPAKPISVPIPAVTPIVQQVGGSLDGAVATVPVVSHIVPADTAGTVVDTVVVPAAGHVDGSVEAVVPPVNDALAPVGLDPVTDVTAPILQPIVDAVHSVLPPVVAVIPPLAPVVPQVPGPGTPVPPLLGGNGSVLPGDPTSVTPGVDANPAAGVASSPKAASASGTAGLEPEAIQEATGPGSANELSPLYSISSVLGPTGTVSAVGAGAGADPESPAGWPADLEAVPAGVAGAGSSNSHNGPPSSAAAFLHGALIIPADALPGLATASEEQHPKPVCFDPGSSPD